MEEGNDDWIKAVEIPELLNLFKLKCQKLHLKKSQKKQKLR